VVRKLIVLSTWLLVTGCGSDKEENSEEKAEVKTGDVEFSGYVQKAFTIKVNDKEFKDSEDFYTRFIEELVKPAYPDVADDQVTIEGKYGLDEFGSLSKVYMSSVAGEGHLYEGRTDAQSKFTVKVQAKALDETFKARVVVRIGLEITTVGGSSLRYCYLLHGNKDSIAISDNSKPIIFEEFATQLTKYKCEEVNEDTLVIPGLEDKLMGTANVSSAFSIQLAPRAEWQGDKVLAAASITDTGELLVVKRAVKKSDGKYCTPTYRFATLQSTSGVESCVGDEDAAPNDAVSVFLRDGELSMEGDNDERLVRVGKYTNGNKVCIGAVCKAAPASNGCDLGYPRTVVATGGLFIMANGANSESSGYCGKNAIHVLASDLTYYGAYSTDAPDFQNSKLAADDKEFYIISLVLDTLIVRKLELTQE